MITPIKALKEYLRSRQESRRRAKAPHVLSAINAMIIEAQKSGQAINSVRLGYLLMIAHIWSLKILDRPLHSGKTISFSRRPFCMDVHKALRPYGTEEIRELVSHPDFDFIDYPPLENESSLQIIRTVLDAYKDISTHQLSKALERNFRQYDDHDPVSDNVLQDVVSLPTAA